MNRLINSSLIMLFIFVSCKSELEPLPCSESEELGLFETEYTLPYSEFEVLEFSNENGKNALVDINHPSALSFANIQQVDTVQEFSDCMSNQEVIRSSWLIEEHNALGSFAANGNSILVKEHVILEAGNEKNGAKERYLSFYSQDSFSGALSDEPFMRFLASSNDQNEYTFGFDYFEETVIDGTLFKEVYVNSDVLSTDFTYIIYNKDTGFRAYHDDATLWVINE